MVPIFDGLKEFLLTETTHISKEGLLLELTILVKKGCYDLQVHISVRILSFDED